MPKSLHLRGPMRSAFIPVEMLNMRGLHGSFRSHWPQHPSPSRRMAWSLLRECLLMSFTLLGLGRAGGICKKGWLRTTPGFGVELLLVKLLVFWMVFGWVPAIKRRWRLLKEDQHVRRFSSIWTACSIDMTGTKTEDRDVLLTTSTFDGFLFL